MAEDDETPGRLTRLMVLQAPVRGSRDDFSPQEAELFPPYVRYTVYAVAACRSCSKTLQHPPWLASPRLERPLIILVLLQH